jgi:hypothetical protein
MSMREHTTLRIATLVAIATSGLLSTGCHWGETPAQRYDRSMTELRTRLEEIQVEMKTLQREEWDRQRRQAAIDRGETPPQEDKPWWSIFTSD